jgi:V/A-type H+-transporting ATPase subunit A
MENSKEIISINGPVVIAKGLGDFAMHEMVYVGDISLLGEIIKIDGDKAIIQVYEETSGLKIREKVIGTGAPLSVELGPGMIGNIFDGIQRPLNELRQQTGDFITKGSKVNNLNQNRQWYFKPIVSIGEEVSNNMIIGEVQETSSIINKIMVPIGIEGKIIEIAPEGEYKITDVIAKVQKSDGIVEDLTMCFKWPVRNQRPYNQRLEVNDLLITGQRVIDSIFPITKGGTAMIPGGFGTGKTMLQHQLAKWCDADIIVYVGCGERGNEMTDVLEEFPKLIDPRTGKSLMERTVLIANTSNMPVAAREASIYVGITIAEYYRDMGYNVAIMADSTSRWAEALREISGRLEEMPAEEGYPSYLPSRLSEFYGRAGKVESYNGNIGTITIIGAVSPQGSDFSEPVTQNTKRFVHVFWALNRELAYSRHYPSVNWNISYSEYINILQDWFEENVNTKFNEYRQQIIQLLTEENELIEISKVVGQDVLSDDKKLILEICKSIKVGFLQQSAMSKIDTSIPLEKQFKMMETIILLYNNSLRLIKNSIPISKIKEFNFFEEYIKLKSNIGNEKEDFVKFDEFNKKVRIALKKLEEEYSLNNIN